MNEMERFKGLPPVEPREMIGLWTGRGIPSGHPLDGVLENLGWFGKRFSAQMRADALLFTEGRSASSPSTRPGSRSVLHSVSTSLGGVELQATCFPFCCAG